MVYKFRHRTLGGHVHIAVFVAKEPNYTFAKSGDLVLSAGPEFEDFKALLASHARVTFEESAA